MKIITTICCIICIMTAHAQKKVTIYRSGVALIPSYSTLDSAITASADGDSIVLSPHTFYENFLVIEKQLKICGTIAGRAKTIIDGSNSATVFGIFNLSALSGYMTVMIKDIDIRNGNGMGTAIKGLVMVSGGAFYTSKGTQLVLTGNTRIYNNKASLSNYGYTTPYPILGTGGAIFAEGDILIQGSTEIFNNTAHWYPEIYCLGTLTMEDHAYFHHAVTQGHSIARMLIIGGNARLSGNDSTYIGASDSILLKDSAALFGFAGIGCGQYYEYQGYVECRDDARIHHNSEYGLLCNKAFIHGKARIDSNLGTGLILTYWPKSLSSFITDSVQIWANGNGGIENRGQSIFISGKASILFNHSEWHGAIYSSSGLISIKDSVIVGFNTSDSSYGTAFTIGGTTLLMNGGQIIGNRCKIDSLKGTGVAVFASSRDSIDIRNARIFNPNGDTIQQNEIWIADSATTFNSDSTWWGDSDTSGVFMFPDASKFNLPSWVKATWSLNSGLPTAGLPVIPLEAHFSLHTGAPLPTYMFWMLAGIYQSDSGYFSPPLSWMKPTNTISSEYHVPWTNRTNKLLAFIDADSFSVETYLSGLNFAQYGTSEVVRVFPNPSSGTVHIESAMALAAIQLYDVNGRSVLNIDKPTGLKHTVTLQRGMLYVLEATTTQGAVYKQTVVVQ